MQRWSVVTLLILATGFSALLYLIGLNAEAPEEQRRAFGIAQMVTGLLIIWVWLAGGLMYRHRQGIRALVLAIPVPWQIKFVLFATLLACLEEAVTVTMTNLAPLFGSRIGEAYITASTSYLDVIALHSVVVFIPFFIVLALLLTRWDIPPFAVFLSFGAVGTVAEAIFAGSLGAVLMFPLWAFVYGLMVWLPAFCLPQDRGARPAGLGVQLFLPIATFGLALPLIAPIVYWITVVLDHPSIDFAP